MDHDKTNKDRKRYLTKDEIKTLISHCEGTEYPFRNKCLIVLAFRHGFRASELCNLSWQDIDFKNKTVYVSRSKNGLSTTHPLKDDEIKALNDWVKERKEKFSSFESDFVFLSKRNEPFTRTAFNQLMETLGKRAGFPFKPFPHMLRHACGYDLANRGFDVRIIQDYLGHRSMNQVVLYTKVNHNRFKDLF